MNDEQLLRYSRQIMLPGLDIEGQERILSARVLIIGMGGLGSPAALYLAAAGVGQLDLVDPDIVDLSNLQRQIVHTTPYIGLPKVESAKQQLAQLNPDTLVTTQQIRLSDELLINAASKADVVLDCSDNFETRFQVNRACVKTATPLVSAAVIRMEGQISVFSHKDPDSACYQCIYPSDGYDDTSCANTGVLAPLPGILGSMQATECLKLISRFGTPLSNRLLLLDALNMEWRSISYRKDPQCSACG